MATIAMCVAFYVNLKTYHAHLQKRDQLLALLKNPNARVAVGKKGKEVVQKLAKKSKALKASAAKTEKKAKSADGLEALIEAAKEKKAVADARSELLLSGYKAPEQIVEQPVLIQQVAAAPMQQQQVNYQLIEPMVQAKPVLQVAPQPQQQFFYPQNFEVTAPLPVPQLQPTQAAYPRFVDAAPAKKLDLADVPKADLIKALMAQLAKDV